jgi:hypothetical protein
MALPEPFRFFLDPLEELGLPYAVTGSVASGVYGEPRTTRDIDIVLLLRLTDLARYRAAFPEEQFYLPPVEVLISEVTRDLRGSYNVVHHGTGFKADLFIARRDQLHQWALAHRRRSKFGEGELWLAPPEYVVLRKLEYIRDSGGEKHVEDIRFIVQSTPLDLDFMEEHMRRLGLREAWARCREGEPT